MTDPDLHELFENARTGPGRPDTQINSIIQEADQRIGARAMRRRLAAAAVATLAVVGSLWFYQSQHHPTEVVMAGIGSTPQHTTEEQTPTTGAILDPGSDPASTAASRGDIPLWPPVSVHPDEYFPLVGECLEEAGFDVIVNDRGFTFPHDQSGSDTKQRECMERVDSSYLEPPPPFTDDQLVDLYEYKQSEVTCYADLGYIEVDLPSFEVFATELRGRFHPVGAISEQSGQVPTENEMETCREGDRPYWFIG